MDKQPKGPNPGIIWCNSKVTNPEAVSREQFSKWYSARHVPDVIQTGLIREAYRYESVDQAAEVPFLALYYAEDIDGLGNKLQSVPMIDETYLGSRNAFDVAAFDTRFYRASQIFERRDGSETQPEIVLSAEMTPADELEFEDWYKKEHLRDGSMIRGWRRTERYELEGAIRNAEAPKYLTLASLSIHLFVDGDGISDEDLAKAGSSEWTQKIMSTMKRVRVTVYRKVSYHKSKL